MLAQPGNNARVPEMTIPEILKDLEPYTGRFPMKAMSAAVEQREAITPDLLQVLEAAAQDPVKYGERQDYMLHLFAVYLLAQFREKRAYPLIVKMVSASGETPFDLLGDTITEALGQILASVYDGDPLPLHSLAESEAVNEFVRSAALNAFLVLEHTGQMPRAEVVDYFRSLFHGKLPRTHSYAWDGLICAVADLPAAVDELRCRSTQRRQVHKAATGQYRPTVAQDRPLPRGVDPLGSRPPVIPCRSGRFRPSPSGYRVGASPLRLTEALRAGSAQHPSVLPDYFS